MDDPRRREEDHLDERVVQDMQDGPVHCQGVVLPQQTQHGGPHQDEPDLRDGRAGQGPLQVHGQHRQHRPQHHGHSAQHGQQHPPLLIMEKDGGGQHQDPVYPRLGDDAGQHRRSRRRGPI